MKKLIIQKNNETIVLPEIDSVVDALSKKQDKTSLSTVATTGDYNDLINKPQIESNKGSLQELLDTINNSDNNSVIILDKDYEFDLTHGVDNIENNVTIYGNGHVIIGENIRSEITITSNSVVRFVDCMFINFKRGFIFNVESTLECDNCTFSYNTIDSVIYGNTNANIVLRNCVFDSNSSTTNNIIHFPMVVDNCIFNNNIQPSWAYTVYGGTATAVNDCRFITNTDTSNITNTSSTVSVVDSVVDGNMNAVSSNAVHDYIDSIIGDINDYITN